MDTLSERLKLFRKRKKITATEAARRLNVPRSTYDDWESGRQISGEPYPKFCEVFGVTYEELFLPIKENERIETFIKEASKLLERAHQEYLHELSYKNRRIRKLTEYAASLQKSLKSNHNDDRTIF